VATIHEDGMTTATRANNEPPPKQRNRIASDRSVLVILSERFTLVSRLKTHTDR
jgi:hypothetical protein